MSRIHEALKKAAQERNALVVPQNGPDLVDLEVEASGRAAIVPESDVSDPAAGAVIKAPSSFDQLVKRCKTVPWKVDSKSSIFVRERENFLVAEKFRTLRSRLYQIAAVQPLRSIVISSSVPAEGKTFVAASLAVSFIRQEDKRVLLIDGDLRASRLHLQLGAPEKPGLSDFLCGKASEPEVIQVGPGGNLCLIPGGSDVTNPSELLHSDRMKGLVDRMSKMFDWVIIDSPPSIAVRDASILADMCDGVLFVVRAGATDFEVAQKASSEFREKSLLGVVLNRVEHADSYNSYYYGYSGQKKTD